MPILAIYSASTWTKDTPEWVYWAAVFPAGLGYSIFLCCGLGKSSAKSSTAPELRLPFPARF